MLRVVLDSNVAISALLFERGRLAWIRDAWTAGRFRPLADRPCLDELVRVLAYPKFDLTDGEIRSLLAGYLPYVETVTGATRVRGIPRCEDPEDRKFLVLAARGRADVLVTGDSALLAVSGRVSFAVENPAGFRARLGPAR